jgi:hypothetical protein
MAEEKYHKTQIATEQLKTAIFLFLNVRDLSSVITLAGASLKHPLIFSDVISIS